MLISHYLRMARGIDTDNIVIKCLANSFGHPDNFKSHIKNSIMFQMIDSVRNLPVGQRIERTKAVLLPEFEKLELVKVESDGENKTETKDKLDIFQMLRSAIATVYREQYQTRDWNMAAIDDLFGKGRLQGVYVNMDVKISRNEHGFNTNLRETNSAMMQEMHKMGLRRVNVVSGNFTSDEWQKVSIRFKSKADFELWIAETAFLLRDVRVSEGFMTF